MVIRASFQRRTAEQNRINQRNLRARRKAYVEELEQRVRKLENERVEATKEVQVAAQRVHKENRLLRWLLETRFGVDAQQISNFLSDASNATDNGTQRPALRPGSDIAMSRVSAELASSLISATNPAEAMRTRVTQDLSYREATSPPEEKQQGVETSPGFSGRGCRSSTTLSTGTDTDAVRSVQVESPTHLVNARPPTTQETPSTTGHQPGDGRFESSPGRHHFMDKRPAEKGTDAHVEETSCDEAARIIARLRGHHTPDDVWNELGCGTKQNCRVRNLAVFELIDKEPS
ncbi:hypothetical protein PV04_08345 [Phialophora macrospora]|uniref:BZIP domain-containing protein n=1 Tax=Phialophora macrospora TaxID=1851006 RepID=A0A0D2FDM5_9EURO|nr:hypothetical protein PV04_08345 [Phialophora macrospora]